jgi:hypothetical protein
VWQTGRDLTVPEQTEPVEVAGAEEVPESWWPADDPRRTRAWALANRWPGDGVSFLVAPGPVFAAVRRHLGWARMNAVDVCAGRGRDVAQDAAVLAAARREHATQLNLALAGYTTPVWAEEPRALPGFLAGVAALADREGARPAVLHAEHDPALLAALAGAGWTVGVTDLYAVITGVGTDLAGYLDGLPSKRRVNIRRDLRRLSDAGGQAELVVGDDIEPYHDEVAALEAATERRHGGDMPTAELREANEQLLRHLGKDLALAVVRGGNGDLVATCSLVATGGRVLSRMVGYEEERARPYAGYFHAAYYLPLRLAWERGADEVLLGTGSLPPKLARGARLRPLYSAVPPGSPATATLLRATDAALREQARLLGHPMP